MDIAEYKNIVIEMRLKLLSISNRIIRNMDDAEDVVQEVCLRIWHMRNDMEQYNNVKALCVTMTKNLSIDRVRGQRYELGDDELLKIDSSNDDMPVRMLEGKEIQRHIRNVINMLPPLQQQVLHLKDIEGYETEEITSIVGINGESVRNNLSRARKRLRELLVTYQKNGRFDL